MYLERMDADKYQYIRIINIQKSQTENGLRKKITIIETIIKT